MPSIQLRHDTSTNWTTYNPVLLEGEVGIETDTNKMKIGDGTTAYNSLDYFGGDIDLSDYYNKTETDELLGEKQDVFSTQAPIAMEASIISSTGNAYLNGSLFTDDILPASGKMTLLKSSTNNANISNFDFTKPYSITLREVKFNSYPSYNSEVLGVYPKMLYAASSRFCSIGLTNTGVVQVYDGGAFSYSQITIPLNTEVDFNISLNSDNYLVFKYKESSTEEWNVIHQFAYENTTLNVDRGIYFHCTSYMSGFLHNVSVINDGNIVFSREVRDTLSLSIGAGLSVDANGNLVNNNPTAPAVMTGATSSTAGTSGLVPAPQAGDDTKFLSGDGTYKTAGSSVTVDQTYDAISTNAQSGTAVAEAISDCVQNDELVEVQVVVESSDILLLPSFYKVFSDGLCIQGGRCTSGTAVTFLKEFANINYINTCSASAFSTTGFTPSTTGSYIVVGRVNLTTANS